MNLKLHRPLCVFDLETTGIRISQDRIVEISILKVQPDGSKTSHTFRVNPTVPIPPHSTAVHGITDADVANEPTFSQLAPTVMQIIRGADLAGFNSNRFDVPLLVEELLRAGQEIDMEKIRLIDAQVIFHRMEPRDLTAAYKFYCGKDLKNAHSAEADTLATFEILDAQVARYQEVPEYIASISQTFYHQKFADLAGFIAYDEEGEEIFTFGKFKGQRVKEIFMKDSSYFGWLQGADFPLYTKRIFTKIQLRPR